MFGEHVIFQGSLICEDSGAGYIPAGSTTLSLAAFHVICRCHRAGHGVGPKPQHLAEVCAPLLLGSVGKPYIR